MKTYDNSWAEENPRLLIRFSLIGSWMLRTGYEGMEKVFYFLIEVDDKSAGEGSEGADISHSLHDLIILNSNQTIWLGQIFAKYSRWWNSPNATLYWKPWIVTNRPQTHKVAWKHRKLLVCNEPECHRATMKKWVTKLIEFFDFNLPCKLPFLVSY